MSERRAFICFPHNDKPFLDRMVGRESIRFHPWTPVEVSERDAKFLTDHYRFTRVVGDPEKWAWAHGAWKRARITVLPNLSIGDTLMAMPAMAALARRYPWMKFTVAAHPVNAHLFRGQEWCDDFMSVWEFNPKAQILASVREFVLRDWAERSPMMKTVSRPEIYAKKLGVKLNGHDIPVLHPDTKLADDLVPWDTKKKWVAIQPRSFSPLRTWDWHWPKEQRFPKAEMLAKKLAGAGYGVIITESRDWKCFDADGITNLGGKTKTSAELASVVSRCDLAVCCGDSGMVHLAGFLRVPFIGIFGPIDPKLRTNLYRVPHHDFFKSKMACVNCQEHIDSSKCGRPCMDFTVEQVYNKAVELMAGKRKEDSKCHSQPRTRKPSSSVTSTSTSTQTPTPAPTRGRKSRSRSRRSSPSS